MAAVAGGLRGEQLRPELYTEPSYERAGYLTGASLSEQSCQHAAVRRLVAQRAAATAHDGQAATMLLLSKALRAFRASMQGAAYNCSTADDQSRQWLDRHFSACFSAWRGSAAKRRGLATLAVEADELRSHTLAARCLAALQRHAACRARNRQLRSTAECFAAFSLVARGLDAWRGVAACAAQRQQRLEGAALHCASRLCCSALAAWHTHARDRLLRQQRGQLALDRLRRRQLAVILETWRGFTRRLRGLRHAAHVTIQQALWGSQEQVAKMCLLAWRAAARRAAQLRASCSQAARMRRLGPQAAAWRAWRRRMTWQRHAAHAFRAMLALRRRLALGSAVRRWQAALHASQANDAGMCYRALHLQRTFAAWAQHTRHRAKLSARLEAHQALLARNHRRRALTFWRGWACSQAAARERQEQALAAWLARGKRWALAAWRQAVRCRVARRMQLQRAEVHRRARRARAALTVWWRTACSLRMSTHWRSCSLLCSTFAAWQRCRQRAVGRAAQWQQAAGHRHSRHVRKALAAWQRAHRLLGQLQERMEILQRRRQHALLRRSWERWAGSCTPAEVKAAGLARAAAHNARRLQRLSLGQWRGPFLLAARQRRRLLHGADVQHAAVLLRRALGALQAWADLCDERRQQALGGAQPPRRFAQPPGSPAPRQQRQAEAPFQELQVRGWVHGVVTGCRPLRHQRAALPGCAGGAGSGRGPGGGAQLRMERLAAAGAAIRGRSRHERCHLAPAPAAAAAVVGAEPPVGGGVGVSGGRVQACWARIERPWTRCSCGQFLSPTACGCQAEAADDGC